MGTDRAEEHSLAAEEPGEQTVDSALPAIAAKADDLEEIKKSVEDAASVSGGLWLSYLFVLSYIAIAAGAVTHEDLLLVRPVKLPFLNVELPLKAFFALAPFIVLIIHAYALMHFIMLGKKASRFHNELRRQFPDKEIRDKLRRLLPSNIFVQILAGPPELRTGIFGSILKLIALTTLVLFPILALLLLQIQFLPFHDVAITNAQRAALFLDIVLLWLLRPPILADLSVEIFGRGHVFARVLRGFGLVLAGLTSILALWFSIVVATIPSEWQETALAPLNPPVQRVNVESIGQKETKLITARDLLFAGKVDETTRRRKSLFSNTLVLPGFNLYEALKIDDPKKLAWKKHLFDLRGRHLEQAVFNGADLTKADLWGAQLQGASLDRARLQGASLVGAQLQRASLYEAQLQSASLNSARLQGALLWSAQLQGALLEGTQFQGASLYEAQLQGASLYDAQLQGASLSGAQLQGASLYDAQLQGASLEGAQLQGALLYAALLQGASLEHAQLQGAVLDGAQLQGASLEGAQLQGASLKEAELQGASLSDAKVDATDFSNAFLWRTYWYWGEIDPPILRAARIDTSWERWGPVWKPGIFIPRLGPWDAKAYADLRLLMKSIPEGKMRDAALKRIERLDCENPNKTLASCEPAAAPPAEVLNWRKTLLKANVDDAVFAKGLATELRRLVCANDINAIHILGGIIRNDRLAATGHEAPALVDFIMSKDCPVSASLTDDDKAKLLQIKQDAEKEFAPPAAARKDK